jgi:twitching motility protein PilT
MITLEQSLTALVKRGLISYEDAVARSLHPKDVEVPLNLQVRRAGAVR